MSSGIVETPSSGAEQQPQQNQPISRARLVQRLLANTASLPNFIHDLILMQAHVVAGTEAVAFLLEPGQDQDGNKTVNMKLADHIRPDESDQQTRAAALEAFQNIMKPCIEQGKDGAIQIEGTSDGSDSQFCLITLLRNEGNIVAASAVITRARDVERARMLLTPMQLVAGYFDLYMLRRREEQSRSIAQSHQHVLQLSTAVATADGFDSAAMNLCNELAARAGAARVSLGWLKGNHIKLKAISHTEEFDKKQELSVQLVKVMEECLDNDEIIQFEPDGTSTDTVTREAQILSRSQSGETVLSLPLRRQGEVVGIVTLEFASTQKIGPQAATGLAVAVELLAPQLFDRYQNDRWLITKTGLSIQELGKKTIGPKYMLAKTIVVAVIVVVMFVTFFKPMYHVTGTFELAPIMQQTIAAPFDNARLIEGGVHVLPGDKVHQGDVLLVFDSYEYQLNENDAEKQAQSSRVKAEIYAKDRTKASEMKEALDDADAAQAKADLYAELVRRSTVRAPFDGVILSGNQRDGDLRDKTDVPFKQGDELMKIAKLDQLMAKMSVAERDIQDIKVGDKGQLATTAEPTDKFPFTIDRIVPESTTKENANVFTVYVKLDKVSGSWTPGLEGEAKVDVGNRRLVWIWMHKPIDWMRMKIWRYIL